MDRINVKWLGNLLLMVLAACIATACWRRGGGKNGVWPEAPVEVSHTTEGDSLWRAVGLTQQLPTTFSAGYKLTFTQVSEKGRSGQKGVQVNGQLRQSADSLLWLTVGMFGVETLQAWVHHDSIWLVNKMEGAVDVYALSVWRERWPFLTLAAQTERQFFSSVLIGVIPEALLQSEVAYMERRPAAEGGAEVLRFGLLPVAGQHAVGLVVCDVAATDFRLKGLYWLTPEMLNLGQPMSVQASELPAAAAAVLDKAAMRMRYPTPESRKLYWRQSDGFEINIKLTFNKLIVNEPVEVPITLPKKYTVRYAE